MNKTCARCEKTVYPIEELKCLDKTWHKGCFKCQECGMTLNMKNYKGYGKLPYCEAHVPKAKATTMAETPELKRIAENTKIQSNVMYHADFEKSKGKFTQVADDPETLRIKANTQIISNVAYHGDLAKKAAMEKQRTLNENGELVELPTPDTYDIQIESYSKDLLPPSMPPPSVPANYQPPKPAYTPNSNDYANSNQYRAQSQPRYQDHNDYAAQNYSHSQTTQNHSSHNTNHSSHAQNHPAHAHNPASHSQNHSSHAQNHPTHGHAQNHPQNNQIAHNANYSQYQPNVQISSYPTQQKTLYDDYSRQSRDMIQREQYTSAQGYQQQQQQQQQRIGKIEDYDPVVDGPRQQTFMPRPSATLIYSSDSNGRGAHTPSQQQSRRIGNVADMDPLAGEPYHAPSHHHHPQQHAPANQQQQHAPAHQQQQHRPSTQTAISGRVYVAMYDYEANDSDEVSFQEGDLISNVTSIDEGWMTGQVLRTGRTGMLPANYVEQAPAM